MGIEIHSESKATHLEIHGKGDYVYEDLLSLYTRAINDALEHNQPRILIDARLVQ